VRVSPTALNKEEVDIRLDTESLAHTQWNCKYHIVFAPKYRRQVIYGKIKGDIGKIIRKLCDFKKVEILEANACQDHIHMLVSIPPKLSVSSFMGYLKGKSSLMIFDRHANLKYKYGNRHFWCRGYYVDTVGRNKKAIEQYIRMQLQKDIVADQLSIKEFIDPFTGEPINKSKKNSH
jgi:putative transposase